MCRWRKPVSIAPIAARTCDCRCDREYEGRRTHNRFEHVRACRKHCRARGATQECTRWACKSSADSSRKDNQRARASAPRSSHPQQNALSSASREPPPAYASPDYANHALADQQKNFGKPRAITCFKCGISGHVASSCYSDARSARKYYACGGIGHMARDCATRAAQVKTQSSFSRSNAVASAGKGAAQVFAFSAIAGVRISDALIDTGSEFSM